MKIIVGNWKMNGSSQQLDEMLNTISQLHTDNRVILCVPYTMLRAGKADIMIGAQNISKYEFGAHTGDISGTLINQTGASVTLVGHSECRTELQDSNQDICVRAGNAIKNDLLPIICVGENDSEYKSGLTSRVIEMEIRQSVPVNAMNGNFIIAYEPKWAIGAGITPTYEQIATVHKHIRSILDEMGYFDTPILYGASVTADNSTEIMSIKNVDGVLVGGASLKIETFIPIIKNAK